MVFLQWGVKPAIGWTTIEVRRGGLRMGEGMLRLQSGCISVLFAGAPNAVGDEAVPCTHVKAE